MTWSYWTCQGDQTRYSQYDYQGCPVGCGPVAWAMSIGWADRRATVGDPYWAPRWGLYRQNGGTGANAVAPVVLDPGITNVISELHNELGTFCIDNQGATFPWSMDSVWRYLNPRTGTWRITHWNSFGFSEDYIRNAAANSIIYRGAPAVIGTGWLSHYPLAYWYAEQRRVVRKSFLWWSWDEVEWDRSFYVNNGWGNNAQNFAWVPASTWFAGMLYP